VLAGFEVLQGLHDSGTLEVLRGMLGGGNKILEIIVESTKSPEAVRGIRNLLILTKVVGSIDPELLNKFTAACSRRARGCSERASNRTARFWEALRILRSKNLPSRPRRHERHS